MGRWVVFMLRMNGHEGFFFGSGLRDGGIPAVGVVGSGS
jgi:hypothetical protein